MIQCLVIDDEQHAIDLLTHHISQTPFLHLAGSTTDPLEGLRILHEQPIDLIFLDVQMPTMSGIDLLRAIQGKARVILTTAYSEYAMEGFENAVIDYLLKPISFARFIKGAQRALAAIQPVAPAPAREEDDFIFIKTEQKGKLIKINIKDILYIEGLKNYVKIHVRQGPAIVALLNLKDLEERLAADFVRTHKSFLVAAACIRMIEAGSVYLEHTTDTVPLGDTYRDAFMTRMQGKILSRK
ncbi:LytR/AlgR family response regulator transcription factor [Chitinophaga lutea]